MRPTRLILPALLLAAALLGGAYVLRSHAAPAAATETTPPAKWEYARLIVPQSGDTLFVQAELTSTILPPQNAPTRRTFHQRPEPTRYTATYPAFDELGTYTIACYALDTHHNTSLPQTTTVTKQDPTTQTPLPVAGLYGLLIVAAALTVAGSCSAFRSA